MALNCQISLDYRSYLAGQTPAPNATLTVYNPGAATVVVTGVELVFKDSVGNVLRPPVQPALVPIGPGQTVSVAAATTITVGPFRIAVGSAAAASSFQMVPPSSQPSNPQPSQPLQSQIFVGAIVYGSDGSVNTAGSDGLLVSYSVPPPLGFQGGFAQFNGANNAVLIAAGVA